MKPFFQKPREDLIWTVSYLLFVGCLCLVGTVISFFDPSLISIPFLAAYAIVLLTLAFGIWQESKIALWITTIVFSIFFVIRVIQLIIEFNWRDVIHAGVSFSIAWSCFDALRVFRADRFEGLVDSELDSDEDLFRELTNDSDAGSELGRGAVDIDDTDAEDASDQRMFSLALLQRSPKYLEAPILASIVSEAWGETYTSEDVEDATTDGDPDETDASESESRSVIGDNPTYLVTSDIGIFMVNNFDTPYFDDVDEVLEDIGELRLRKSVAEHNAWISVDWMVVSAPDTDEELAYSRIVQLILELADDETLAVFRPETGELNVWSPALEERLAAKNGHRELSTLDNTPVIPVEEDDPRMAAAVEEARSRWDEFKQVFAESSDSSESSDSTGDFVIKVRLNVDDVTEYIWLDFLGAEPKFLHGRLANDPVDLGHLSFGDQVEVPIEDLLDWGYLRENEPVGFFSVHAMQAILKERHGDSEPPPF